MGLLEGIVFGAMSFFGLLIDLMPTIDIQIPQLNQAIDFFVNLVSAAGILIPVSDIFIILGLVMIVRSSMFLVYIVNWIIRRIGDIIP